MKMMYAPGSTPLDPDEIAGLIPSHITTQSELNEWEQTNIIDAESWLLNYKKIPLDDLFTRHLHKKMFGETWGWAGEFRNTNKNIGVDWCEIPSKLRLLFDDLHYQLHHNSYDLDEIAARFHHRLVAIHPFPNGNGRHARLMADCLLINHDAERFSWGNRSLVEASHTRQQYIDALRSADRHDYRKLFDFVRT